MHLPLDRFVRYVLGKCMWSGFWVFSQCSQDMVDCEGFLLFIGVFADTNVSVTSEGRPYLGSPLGTASFVSQFVEEKVEQWVGELKMLSDMALAHPHAAFTHGFKSLFG